MAQISMNTLWHYSGDLEWFVLVINVIPDGVKL